MDNVVFQSLAMCAHSSTSRTARPTTSTTVTSSDYVMAAATTVGRWTRASWIVSLLAAACAFDTDTSLGDHDHHHIYNNNNLTCDSGGAINCSVLGYRCYSCPNYCCVEPCCCQSVPQVGPPLWPPVWDLGISTYLDYRYSSVGENASSPYCLDGAEYGVAQYDGSNSQVLWMAAGTGRAPSCCSGHGPFTRRNWTKVQLEQARRVKRANLNTRVLLYRNFALALGWIREQWDLMMNPSNAGMFLRFPNGSIYDEAIDAGSQFFWDFRNQVGNYLISERA